MIENINPGMPIQLILRVTSRCNFDCTFCSASDMEGEMSVEDVLYYVKRYQPVQSLIFEGGDPLCKPPSFYWEIINTIREQKLDVGTFGITTNLWDFYKRPEKWIELFKHPDVHVCTSFQYGNKRRIGDKVFDEATFVKIYTLYAELVDKPLSFISVIDEDNRDTVLQTVKLAKRLNTFCKINAAFVSGRQKSNYSLPDILTDYYNIIKSGLSNYEDNCDTLIKKLKGSDNSIHCPFFRQCNRGMRCISPDGECSTCSTENNWSNSAPLNRYGERDITMLTSAYIVKPQCLTCEYFEWCNSCRVNILAAKDTPNFCERMKTIIPKIMECVDQM